MARPRLTRSATGAAEVKQAAAAEAVVVESTPINTTPDTPDVLITAVVPFATAAESTTVEVTIRREGVEGAEVAKVITQPGASNQAQITLEATDNPGEVAGLKYVVTVKPGVAKEVNAKRARIRVEY